MSFVVRIGDAPERPSRRVRARLLIGAGACVGLLLLAALPLPRIREARDLGERCDTLEEQVEQARADAAAVRSWDSGEREQAPALQAEYRRWFSSGRPLREVRDALRTSSRALGVQIVTVDVVDDAGGEVTFGESAGRAGAIALTREVLRITGRGGAEAVARLAATLPTLDPPLRLLTLELKSPATTRTFTLVAERFHERHESGTRQGDRR